MGEGYRWAVSRDEGIDVSWRWTVPYTSSQPRALARDSIREHGRPAIVGTGYYEHYPLAYGYRWREYRALGITWRTERQWRVNNGHADSGGLWLNANNCWFGTDGRCF
jgi:hypothetical protein